MARGDLQTPYNDAVMPTPSGAASGGTGTTGGADLDGGRKETPNSMSGVPTLPDTYTVDGAPGADSSVGMPPVQSPGTLQG